MSMVINSNIMSLNAQNQLSKSQGDMRTSMERLTSGLRINGAKDDAAGLAITNRMSSQVRGLDQAVRNANDGISMIQTAEGALAESTNILQRMRELSVQSASGTYSEGNRATINAEVQQLKSELDRIAQTTSFNGLSILDGTLGKTTLQVGAESNQTIDVNIGKMDTKALGLGAGADIVGSVSRDGGGAIQNLFDGLTSIDDDDEVMKVNGVSVGDLSLFEDESNSLQDVLNAMNNTVSTVTFGAITSATAQTFGDGIFSGDEGLYIEVAGIDVQSDQIGSNVQTLRIQNTSSMAELIDKINTQGAGLVRASLNESGKLNISSDSASQLTIRATENINAATPTADGDLNLSALGIEDDQEGVGTNILTQEARLTITSNSGGPITVTYTDTADLDDAVSAIGIDQRWQAGTIVGSDQITDQELDDIDAGDVTINGVVLGEYNNDKDYTGNGEVGEVQDFIAWINSYQDQTGVIASLDDTETAGEYALKLTSKDGSEISIQYKDDDVRDDMLDIWSIRETNNVAGFGGDVASINVSTAAGAQKAIDIIDGALGQINDLRGDLGAINNRLEYTMNNLSNISQNVSAARSRIEDADFAVESANLSRSQVLQQAGTAMLAQANAQPQQVLSLLQ